ncbi:MAG: bifunctional DNA-binding transcriptional regulator/O6-methylguanine-DNA methyltransferase Ada [Gluconacetobacter diazotrophicus]|nr:bifunctional DNA-binding transcriptional regulator/O6-methylguanine-DNA methyltransferase Ada [Gluconacetobacter diazotrophicus]
MGGNVAADPRWARVVARDRGADGSFWFSVRTTGVYCRPSCPARRARPENVRLHDTAEAARAAGNRACRRCDPDGTSAGEAGRVARACRRIEAAEVAPALNELAREAGLSAGHFHRMFKRHTGVTPKGYALAWRARRVRDGLRTEATVTEAVFGAGFNSSARFYAQAEATLGMTPKRFRAGGAAEVLRVATGECSLGMVLVASSAAGVAAILLGDGRDALLRELRDRFPRAELVEGDRNHEAVVAAVVRMVEAPGTAFDLPLDVRGTAFQRRVWEELRRIPAGRTESYAAVAVRAGVPGAVRAVAGACAANALAVAIPCHRVVRGDGALSGYRWGVERKRALLHREGAPKGNGDG